MDSFLSAVDCGYDVTHCCSACLDVPLINPFLSKVDFCQSFLYHNTDETIIPCKLLLVRYCNYCNERRVMPSGSFWSWTSFNPNPLQEWREFEKSHEMTWWRGEVKYTQHDGGGSLVLRQHSSWNISGSPAMVKLCDQDTALTVLTSSHAMKRCVHTHSL